MASRKSTTISAKLLFSNLAYIIPIVVLIYFMTSTSNVAIRFGEAERVGMAYQQKLMPLMQHLGRHAILAQRVLHGETNAEAEMTNLQTSIAADIEKVESGQELATTLQFTNAGLTQRGREHFRIETLKTEWTDLKAGLGKMKPSESAEKHAHLIADLRTMISHLGDTSNLILDPDLDSYYLMDVTLLALPQMQERLVDIITRTEGILHRKAVTPDERIWLATSSAFLKQMDLDRVVADIQTALNEDKNFSGESASLQANAKTRTDEIKKRVEDLLAALQKIQLDGPASPHGLTAAAYAKITDGALGESFGYWTSIGNELDQLLSRRIQIFETQKKHDLIYSFAAVLLAGIASTLLGLSVRNGIIRDVSGAVANLQAIGGSIGESNAKLVGASNSLSTETTQQASAIQQIVSTLDEISSMTNRSAASAQTSAVEADVSHKAALEGKESVQRLTESMNDISENNSVLFDQVTESNEKIVDIVKMIREIGEKTKVINDIVFQTKLLSFNASVEAARAGEHGKGFAVVAEEVGKLAQMSGNAAKEISSLLEQSTQRVISIVDTTKETLDSTARAGRAKIEHGLEIAGECEKKLGATLEKIQIVSKMMAEIASAANEQSIGVTEINKAMGVLDNSTHKTSATAGEAAALAQRLEINAQDLQEAMQSLARQVGSKTSGASDHASAPVADRPPERRSA